MNMKEFTLEASHSSAKRVENVLDIFLHSESAHRVLGGLLTFKKIHRSWDMCFLMQNDMGINVY